MPTDDQAAALKAATEWVSGWLEWWKNQEKASADLASLIFYQRQQAVAEDRAKVSGDAMEAAAEGAAGWLYKVIVNKHVTGPPLEGQIEIAGVWGTRSNHLHFSPDVPTDPWIYWKAPVFLAALLASRESALRERIAELEGIVAGLQDVIAGKKYKSIGLQLAAFTHKQDSYFGLTTYNAQQQNFYGNLIYQSIIGTTAHKFRTGLSFLYDKYNEDFNTSNYKRTESVPGAFFEYTYDYLTKLSIVAGLRADDNNLYGWFVTPRLHLRYEPVKGTSIRISAGRGQRTANIFAENTGVFVSSRQLQIIPSTTGKAYGLNPEVAWNKGISLDQQFKLFSRTASLALDFFRNDFQQQLIADLETPGQIKFYNLAGKSYSNSFQAELNTQPIRNLEVRIAYRLFDVKTTYGNTLLQKPFTAKNRAFINLGYEIKGWKFDYTVSYNGQKRIPSTAGNPLPDQRNTTSPAYVLMNAQVSKGFGKKYPVELYLGGENLTNFFQHDAIIAAEDPFGPHFDASLVWGPIAGRQFYGGLRFKLK